MVCLYWVAKWSSCESHEMMMRLSSWLFVRTCNRIAMEVFPTAPSPSKIILHCNRSGSSSSDEPPAVAISNKLVVCVLFQTIDISTKDLVQVLRCSPQWRTRTVNAKMHASVCSCSFPPPIRCYSNTRTSFQVCAEVPQRYSWHIPDPCHLGNALRLRGPISQSANLAASVPC